MSVIVYESGGTFPQPKRLTITPAVRAKVKEASKLLTKPNWAPKLAKMFPGHTMDELTELFLKCA